MNGENPVLIRVLALLKGETIILAMLPIAGWFLSLAFEIGVLFYFDVPSSFAEVGVTQAIFALSITAAVVVFFSSSDIWRAWWLLNSKKAKNILVISLGLLLILSVVLGLIVNWRDGTLLEPRGIVFILVAILIVMQLVLPQKQSETRTAEKNKAESSELPMDQYGKEMFQKYGRPLITIGGFWFAAFLLGYGYAAGGDEFYVSADEPNLILVRRYGDTYIFKESDIGSLEIRGGIKIQKIGDGKELSLKKVWISSLRNPARPSFKERLRYIIWGPTKRTVMPETFYHGPY